MIKRFVGLLVFGVCFSNGIVIYRDYQELVPKNRVSWPLFSSERNDSEGIMIKDVCTIERLGQVMIFQFRNTVRNVAAGICPGNVCLVDLRYLPKNSSFIGSFIYKDADGKEHSLVARNDDLDAFFVVKEEKGLLEAYYPDSKNEELHTVNVEEHYFKEYAFVFGLQKVRKFKSSCLFAFRFRAEMDPGPFKVLEAFQAIEKASGETVSNMNKDELELTLTKLSSFLSARPYVDPDFVVLTISSKGKIKGLIRDEKGQIEFMQKRERIMFQKDSKGISMHITNLGEEKTKPISFSLPSSESPVSTPIKMENGDIVILLSSPKGVDLTEIAIGINILKEIQKGDQHKFNELVDHLKEYENKRPGELTAMSWLCDKFSGGLYEKISLGLIYDKFRENEFTAPMDRKIFPDLTIALKFQDIHLAGKLLSCVDLSQVGGFGTPIITRIEAAIAPGQRRKISW